MQEIEAQSNQSRKSRKTTHVSQLEMAAIVDVLSFFKKKRRKIAILPKSSEDGIYCMRQLSASKIQRLGRFLMHRGFKFFLNSNFNTVLMMSINDYLRKTFHIQMPEKDQLSITKIKA